MRPVAVLNFLSLFQVSLSSICIDYTSQGYRVKPADDYLFDTNNPANSCGGSFPFRHPGISVCELEQLHDECAQTINTLRQGEGRPILAHRRSTNKCANEAALGDIFFNYRGVGIPIDCAANTANDGCYAANSNSFGCLVDSQYDLAYNFTSCCAVGDGADQDDADYGSYSTTLARMYSCIGSLWEARGVEYDVLSSLEFTQLSCGFAWSNEGRVVITHHLGDNLGPGDLPCIEPSCGSCDAAGSSCHQCACSSPTASPSPSTIRQPALEVIVDNDSDSVVQIGVFARAGNSLAYKNNFLVGSVSIGSVAAIFTAENLYGLYRVSLNYPLVPSSAQVPVSVEHHEGTSLVLVDMSREIGVNFLRQLGVFFFDGIGKVVFTVDENGGDMLADAVKFQLVSNTPTPSPSAQSLAVTPSPSASPTAIELAISLAPGEEFTCDSLIPLGCDIHVNGVWEVELSNEAIDGAYLRGSETGGASSLTFNMGLLEGLYEVWIHPVPIIDGATRMPIVIALNDDILIVESIDIPSSPAEEDISLGKIEVLRPSRFQLSLEPRGISGYLVADAIKITAQQPSTSSTTSLSISASLTRSGSVSQSASISATLSTSLSPSVSQTSTPSLVPLFSVVIDSESSAFSENGGTLSSGWTSEASELAHDGSSLVKQSFLASNVVFKFTAPAQGSYDIFLWYVSGADRETDVTVLISGVSQMIDMTQGGNGFEFLGTFSYDEGDVIRVDILAFGTTDQVSVDAIRIQETSVATSSSATISPSPLPDYTLGLNSELILGIASGSIGTSISGVWSEVSDTAAVEGTFLRGSASQGSSTIVLTFGLPRGWYLLDYGMAPSVGTSSFDVEVKSQQGLKRVRTIPNSDEVDGGWYPLGVHYFDALERATIVIPRSFSGDVVVQADALRIRQQIISASQSPSPTISPSSSRTPNVASPSSSPSLTTLSLGNMWEFGLSLGEPYVKVAGNWDEVVDSNTPDGTAIVGREVEGAEFVSFNIPLISGQYLVELYVTGDANANAVPVMTFSRSVATTYVNLNMEGGWVTVGSFLFTSDSLSRIVVATTGTSNVVGIGGARVTLVNPSSSATTSISRSASRTRSISRSASPSISAAPRDILVDSILNSNLVQLSGTWNEEINNSAYANAHLVGEGIVSATFTLDLTSVEAESGSYDLLIRYTASPARSTHVDVRFRAFGIGVNDDVVVALNMREGGKDWQHIGSYSIADQQSVVTVEISSNGEDGNTIADAVRLNPVRPSTTPTQSISITRTRSSSISVTRSQSSSFVAVPASSSLSPSKTLPIPLVEEIVVDSGDPFAPVVILGNWLTIADSNAIGGSLLSGSSLFATSISYFATVPRAVYRFEIYYRPVSTLANNVPVLITANSGGIATELAFVELNMRIGQVGWNILHEGLVNLDSVVKLELQTSSSGNVAADAIRITRVTAAPSFSTTPSPSPGTVLSVSPTPSRPPTINQNMRNFDIDSSGHTGTAQTSVEIDGTWSSQLSPNGYNGDYLFGRAVDGARSVTYSAAVDPADYQFQIFFFGFSSRSSAVPVTIRSTHLGSAKQTETTVIRIVDMTVTTDGWLTFHNATYFQTTLVDITISTEGTDRVVVADAIRFLNATKETSSKSSGDGTSSTAEILLPVSIVVLVLLILVVAALYFKKTGPMLRRVTTHVESPRAAVVTQDKKDHPQALTIKQILKHSDKRSAIDPASTTPSKPARPSRSKKAENSKQVLDPIEMTPIPAEQNERKEIVEEIQEEPLENMSITMPRHAIDPSSSLAVPSKAGEVRNLSATERAMQQLGEEERREKSREETNTAEHCDLEESEDAEQVAAERKAGRRAERKAERRRLRDSQKSLGQDISNQQVFVPVHTFAGVGYDLYGEERVVEEEGPAETEISLSAPSLGHGFDPYKPTSPKKHKHKSRRR